MTIHAFFVVNKAGGLVMQRNYSDRAPQLSQNDYLHLASTFHGVQLLAKELSPVSSASKCGAIERLQADSFTLHALATATGLEFFVTCDSVSERMGDFLREVYSSYSDYVMKNPFYEIDMPIKSELWDTHLRNLVDKYNKLIT